jgi:predicted outer membrane repeat protein
VSISSNYIQLHFDSVQLIESSFSIDGAELGEIVKLQAHNSHVSIRSSNNVIFTNCTFHDFESKVLNARQYDADQLLIPAAVTVHQSHNITFADNSKFYSNHNSALVSYLSVITFAGSVSFFNNSGIRGGAMALYSSTLNLASTDTNILFINNLAQETGGAIHIEPDLTRMVKLECFYQTSYSNTVTLYFTNNSATFGGDNVYGTSLVCCEFEDGIEISHQNRINTTLLDTRGSSVSSDPIHVCICDNEGRPQCTNTPFINMSKSVYPSERFTLSAAIVGADYGMTVGIVYANFLTTNKPSRAPIIIDQGYQYSQWINNVSCTKLTYSIYTVYNIEHSVIMYLTAQYTKNPRHLAEQNQWKYCENFLLIPSPDSHYYCRYSPIYINVTILPCPPGFTLLKRPSSSRCDCYPPLIEKGIQCTITNGTGYFIWNNALWMSINEKKIIYAENCPLNHCTITNKTIDLIANPNAQCAFNRAGRLCGSCRKGYTLAIGSSNCIYCPNNSNIALAIFFIVAGFLLVFFISILNLTITQGMINGLIFYANIVWTSQSILLPFHDISNAAIVFLRAFLAWINLDFGIETCFISGLTALVKTWLQFLFPIYIWTIAGLMIITAKYSKALTKIYGNRAVPLLATLFLLSYT